MRGHCRNGPCRDAVPLRGVIVPLLAAAAVFLASCASPKYSYKIYGGAPRPASDIAVIELAGLTNVVVAQRKVSANEYSRIELLPGTYRIQWECVRYDASSIHIKPNPPVDVTLVAGHVYALHCDFQLQCEIGQSIYDVQAGENAVITPH
jgi:hypothetical protein